MKHLAACGIYLNGKLSSGHTALTFAAQKKLTALTQVLVEGNQIDYMCIDEFVFILSSAFPPLLHLSSNLPSYTLLSLTT